VYITSTFGHAHWRWAAVGERRQMCEQPPFISAQGLCPVTCTQSTSVAIFKELGISTLNNQQLTNEWLKAEIWHCETT